MALFAKPRIVTLIEVASRAELLRRRRQVRTVVLRSALGGAAAVFGLLMLLWLHATAWAALAEPFGQIGAALAVGAFDLAVLLVLAWLGGGRRASAAADEAAAVRDRALAGAQIEVETLGGLIRR